MKKSIIIFSAIITAFSLTAFGYMNWNNAEKGEAKASCRSADFVTSTFVNNIIKPVNTDFIYNVESRFMTTISKENLHKAKSILDILPEDATASLSSYKNVKVSVLGDSNETTEIGKGSDLNAAQTKLLQSTDYSVNISIRADCKNKKAETGEIEDYDLVYYITIIPEIEAEYSAGQDALIDYLKKNSAEKTTVIEREKLRPGQISFTVSKSGKIENAKLGSSSGYPSMDKSMVELIKNMPGKWEPAKNSTGENVDQEFVFFFGMQGC